MSCHDFERLVALSVEGDLDGMEQRRVESHLAMCSACRGLAEELKESQAAFKSIRQDLPDQTMLRSVRTRVLDDVAGMHSLNWFERLFLGGLRQRATLAGIALLVVGGWIIWNLQNRDVPVVVVPPPPVVAVHQAQVFTEEVDVTPAIPRVVVPKPRIRQPRPVPAAVPEELVEPVMAEQQVPIKFVTDNPNVIIYWLGDQRKGD